MKYLIQLFILLFQCNNAFSSNRAEMDVSFLFVFNNARVHTHGGNLNFKTSIDFSSGYYFNSIDSCLYVESTNIIDQHYTEMGETITLDSVTISNIHEYEFDIHGDLYGIVSTDSLPFIEIKTDSLVSFGLKVPKINKLIISNNYANTCKVNYCIITKTNIDTLEFNSCYFDKKFININETTAKNVSIINSIIENSLVLRKISQPKSFKLSHIEFVNEKSYLDLTQLNFGEDSVCNLIIDDLIDFSKLNLNYENFVFQFDSTFPTWKIEKVYLRMLENQNNGGFTYGYQKLDKKYKEFEYTKDKTPLGFLKNYLDDWWWDYGYNKFKVIQNSIEIFLFFLVLNIFLYPKLLAVFCPSKFKELEQNLVEKCNNLLSIKDKIKFRLYRLPITILYTSCVFWGLRFDFNELEYNKPLLFILLGIEYLTGIVCLAYIANYIITK